MKVDTFLAFTITAVVAVSVALISPLEAEERYKHHCSANPLNPTLIETGGKPLTKPIVSVITRRYFPGVNPNVKVKALADGRQYFQSRFMSGENWGTLTKCYFRNEEWTVK